MPNFESTSNLGSNTTNLQELLAELRIQQSQDIRFLMSTQAPLAQVLSAQALPIEALMI